ncbi:pleckstrin homology domain-containing family G member 5-like isoform X2 [Ornithodoros turicata]|uniref:pleckstrin homology domain-containing family G member 5-like isoform X2 n=1 Tax=Ornithodoros turicata TaxID=34597 RepID=UPI00313929AF
MASNATVCHSSSSKMDGFQSALSVIMRRRCSTGSESNAKKRLQLFHVRQRSCDSAVGAPTSLDSLCSSIPEERPCTAPPPLLHPEKDLSTSSLTRKSKTPSVSTVRGEDDIYELLSGCDEVGDLSSLSTVQSAPYGLSELGDGSPTEDKRDVYSRIFTKRNRNWDKGSLSGKSKAVRIVKGRSQELQPAHRSKSLTQIDCIDSGGSMVRKEEQEASGGSSPSDAGAGPPPLLHAGATGGSGPLLPPPPSPDRLSVPDESSSAVSQRRLLRTTNRVPSQEYVSITLEDDYGDQQFEAIPAIKGVILRDALQGVLERRGLDVGCVHVYVDGSKKTANLSYDTHKYAGTHIRVKAKEGTELASSVTRANSTSSLTGGSWKTPASRTNSNAGPKEDKKERKVSGSQRGRRGAMSTEDLVSDTSILTSASQEGTWKAAKSRPTLGKRTGILLNAARMEKVSQDKEDMRLLTELLNSYDQNGIPNLQGLLTFGTSSNEEKFKLEDNWRVIAENADSYPKRVRNQQDAIWELISTEVSYIRTLKVITELFLSCLCNLQTEGILQDIDTEQMFSNITEVYHVNHNFWDTCLMPTLASARHHRGLLDPILLRDGFLQFESSFQPYMKYCLEQSTCLQYVKEKRIESDLFKTYVAWCEARKDCERLRFTDLLVKPMQRLTKYSLLLKAIHKKTDDEDAKHALIEMNDCVGNFVCAVDGKLRQRHELERLKSIISRIESYDPFDISNDEVEKALKGHCDLDLTCPMPGCGNQQSRQLLFETSGIKMKDAGSSSKVDVHCFLFTDMLLICKSLSKKGDRVKVIRQPFMVERLVIHELRDGSGLIVVYLNDFGVVSSYFLLYTNDTRNFVDQIKRAQEQYREARAAAANEKPQFGYLRDLEDEEDYDIPRSALLAAARSPRSSSHSSLVHSHSGSIDMSDPASTASVAAIPPVPCPTPLFGSSMTSSNQGRATSFELGELRNPSMTCDDLDEHGRSRSMETRASGPVCVTVTSPRPERRAFLLRGSGNNHAPNTLTVNVPFTHQESEESREPRSYPTSPTIQSKSLSPTSSCGFHSPKLCYTGRISPTSCTGKPPLLKTKNVSGLATHSAPPSEGPSPVHSLEGVEGPLDDTALPDSGDDSERKRPSRRAGRPDRRHHTADSFEHLKNQRDPSIHKRLSWNCGQQHDPSRPPSLLPSEVLLKNKHVSKCLSSESMYSSSGVSSTGSLLFSSTGSGEGDACDCCDIAREEDHPPVTNGGEEEGTGDLQRSQPGSSIKIDVSEVKDGISSVQIVAGDGPLSGGKPGKPSRSDLQKMKEFLLNSCSVEASEV